MLNVREHYFHPRAATHFSGVPSGGKKTGFRNIRQLNLGFKKASVIFFFI